MATLGGRADKADDARPDYRFQADAGSLTWRWNLTSASTVAILVEATTS